MLNVVVSDHNFASLDLQRQLVESAGAGFVEMRPVCVTETDVIERCAEADVLLVQRAPVTRRALQTLTRLKGIVRYGIGVDMIDLDAAKEFGVGVANIPTYCLQEVSNHAMAMILSLARRIPQEHRGIVEGGWRLNLDWPPAFTEMTLGLIGFGLIARQVSRKAAAFGFQIIAADPFVDEQVLAEMNVKRVELDTLFTLSDIISLHCPLLPATKHLIRRETVARMKPGVIIVNTSRGGIIREIDLIEALKSGVISGAGLDVFEQEPLPAASPLRGFANVILTSHSASYSQKSLETLQTQAAEAAIELAHGRRAKSQIV